MKMEMRLVYHLKLKPKPKKSKLVIKKDRKIKNNELSQEALGLINQIMTNSNSILDKPKKSVNKKNAVLNNSPLTSKKTTKKIK